MIDKDGIIISVSRVYCDANKELGPEWYNFRGYNPVWNPPDKYFLKEKVGRGKYSTVFRGVFFESSKEINTKTNVINNNDINIIDNVINNGKKHHKRKKNTESKKKSCLIEAAIKILVPLDPHRYLKEIKILTNLRNGTNIVNLIDLVCDNVTNTYSFIFEWVNFYDWKALYRSFAIDDIRIYGYKLLEALDYSHQRGIIHRDVKPANVAIDKEKQTLKLIDWGLADFYFPKQSYSSHVGTRLFKPPELLINYPYYDYSLDIWAAGVTFSTMIFGGYIFQNGENDIDQLYKIGNVVGGEEILKYAASLEIKLDERMVNRLQERLKGLGIESFGKKSGKKIPTDAFDLLNKMLDVDHRTRITAKEAMYHPFFDGIRKHNI